MFTSLSQIFKNNMKKHFTSEHFCHESYQVYISNGSSLGQWELATYLVAMVTWLQGNQRDTSITSLS